MSPDLALNPMVMVVSMIKMFFLIPNTSTASFSNIVALKIGLSNFHSKQKKHVVRCIARPGGRAKNEFWTILDQIPYRILLCKK